MPCCTQANVADFGRRGLDEKYQKVEYPFAQSIYKLYGRESWVENAHFENEGHDYGKNKRLAAYQFLAEHLSLKIENIMSPNGKVSEDFVSLLDRNDLNYFNKEELTSLIKGDEVYKAFVKLKSEKN